MALILKWSESSCSILANTLRADLRVIHDQAEGQQNTEYDMMQVEASRISPTPQKFDFDSVKLLIETKDNLDSLQEHVAYGLCCIQFCGLELYKHELTHVFDILYTNNKVAFNSMPPAVTSFKNLKDLCSILLATRNEWISLQRIIILAKNSLKAAYPKSNNDDTSKKRKKKEKSQMNRRG